MYAVSCKSGEVFKFSVLMGKLLGSFVDSEKVDKFVDNLFKTYGFSGKEVYIWEVIGEDELFLTYNLDTNNLNKTPLDTMIVHRKPAINCFFTLNGLNALIRKQNNGVLDKKFSVDFSEYRDTILSYRQEKLHIYKIIFKRVLHFKKKGLLLTSI